MLSRFLCGISPLSCRVLSLIPLVILAVAGCGDETAGPSGNALLDPFSLWASTGNATYGQLYVTANWGQRANISTYWSGGQVFTTTGHDTAVSGGTMVAGSATIRQLSPGNYDNRRPVTFGAVTAWGLSGNSAYGIPAFTDSMYVPAEIRITAPSVSIASISRTSSLTITWNVDPNNIEGVLVVVDYRADLSRERDTTLPTTPYRWTTITDDDGSYTVSASDLAGLPAGGLAEITIARGASKTSGTLSRPFHIYAYSTSDVLHKVSP